ncbi:MAG: 5-oxoprolinase subunit PxpB [Gemmatimonadales bacterium]|nr:5-oxoprolinase subunit PxpB [Gemmatimonadales bacterium]
MLPLGGGAWTIRLGDVVSRENHARVTALAGRLADAAIPGVLEVLPAYATVTVFFDPARVNPADIRSRIEATLALPRSEGAEHPAGRLVEIPVRYDGPDLHEVADRTGLAEAEVVARHSTPEYLVYLLGFVPGFAYLGDLDPALVLPRRAAPRTRVPAGSVAIAGAQTGVYPFASPGGWHLLGSTTLRLFDPARTPPALLSPGDRVRFTPV